MYFYAPLSLTVKRVTEGDKPGGVQEKNVVCSYCNSDCLFVVSIFYTNMII